MGVSNMAGCRRDGVGHRDDRFGRRTTYRYRHGTVAGDFKAHAQLPPLEAASSAPVLRQIFGCLNPIITRSGAFR
jgi:hypothetical protein